MSLSSTLPPLLKLVVCRGQPSAVITDLDSDTTDGMAADDVIEASAHGIFDAVPAGPTYDITPYVQMASKLVRGNVY